MPKMQGSSQKVAFTKNLVKNEGVVAIVPSHPLFPASPATLIHQCELSSCNISTLISELILILFWCPSTFPIKLVGEVFKINLVWTCVYLACDHLVLWSVDIAFKKIIMMLIEGLKSSLDEQGQILIMRKRNVAWQNNKKSNYTIVSIHLTSRVFFTNNQHKLFLLYDPKKSRCQLALKSVIQRWLFRHIHVSLFLC